MPGLLRRVHPTLLAESNSLAARCLSHEGQWNGDFRFRENQSGFCSAAETLPGTPMRLVRSMSSRPIAALQNAAYRSHSESYGHDLVSLAWKRLETLFSPRN